MAFGAFLAVRDFECILCRRQFSLLTQDFIVPWTLICDKCLVEIWEMEGDALAQHLAAPRLAENPSGSQDSAGSSARPHPYERQIVAHLLDLKQRFATAQEAIRNRDLARQDLNPAGGDATD